MPPAPRGKRVQNADTGTFIVVGRAPKGQAAPYFDKSHNVWVAPWTKPDGKTGRPTGRTRALAEASRDRHTAAAAETAKFAPLAEGFHEGTTIAELSRWWLDNVARHRVRGTTWTTYDKQLRLVATHLGDVPVRKLRIEQVTSFVAKVVAAGSAARACNVRVLLVQVMDEAVNLGLAEENVVKKVRPPRVPKVKRLTLGPADVRRLFDATDDRFVAAVASVTCRVGG